MKAPCENCTKSRNVDDLEVCPECGAVVCVTCLKRHNCETSDEGNTPKAVSIQEGIGIILSVDPKAETGAEHDVFYCGEYKQTRVRMTLAQRERLGELGWFELEGSWCIFV